MADIIVFLLGITLLGCVGLLFIVLAFVSFDTIINIIKDWKDDS